MNRLQLSLWGLACAVSATQAHAQAIYTCVDAKGRRLTSDRPIIDCIDREQKELNPSGTVRRKLGPSLTAEERAAEDERARREAEERQRVAEEKRRDRALLARYPNKASHDRERAAALATVDEVTAVAQTRGQELVQQRKKLDAEAEFYVKDPSKMPAQLRRAIEQNDQERAALARFVSEQGAEKARVNMRFDEELVRLRRLWQGLVAPAAAASRSPQP